MAGAELPPVGEDGREDAADFGRTEQQEPMTRAPGEGPLDAPGARRLQLQRVVRGGEHEATVRREAEGQAKLVQDPGHPSASLPVLLAAANRRILAQTLPPARSPCTRRLPPLNSDMNGADPASQGELRVGRARRVGGPGSARIRA
jgi:hypothetical protein